MIIGSVYSLIITIMNLVGDVSTLDGVRSAPMLYPDGMETAALITLIAEIAGLLAISLAILYLVDVFRRKPKFLLYYQIYVIVSILYTIFALIVPSSIIGYEHAMYGSMGFHVGNLIWGIMAFFLWTLYYCKSVRVRTYMGSDEYMERAIFAYKDQPPLQ